MTKFDLDKSIEQFSDEIQQYIDEQVDDFLSNFMDEQSEGEEDSRGNPILTPFEYFLDQGGEASSTSISALVSAIQEAVEKHKARLKLEVEAWLKKNPQPEPELDDPEDDTE